MVVDYRGQLASSEADRQRAKESHIEIVAGAQLKDLKGVIGRLWLQPLSALRKPLAHA
jgi:hypothetical protein